jgi:amidase
MVKNDFNGESMKIRKVFLPLLAILVLTACAGEKSHPVEKTEKKQFAYEETTIVRLGKAMAAGECSSAGFVADYLRRIDEIDRSGPCLGAIIEVNPDALAIARELDRERSAKGPRGPLHGIPILIKDNIDTADRMETTAGSLALAGSKPVRDAFIVRRLRAAGAVILGKTNLSEWANFRSTHSSSGWSGRGGQTRNPYALDRNPSGSSSGSAVAVSANLVVVAVGTETDGSIVSPASVCGIVGLKPTVGLVSRSGIVPIAHSQDTAGPMARTVTDAAIVLSVLAGPDPDDSATKAGSEHVNPDYTKFLDADGLKGARLGIVRSASFNFNPNLDPLLAAAIEKLKNAGAIVVDPLELPNVDKVGDSEFEVLLFEFKADLASYLAARSGAAIHGLADLMAFNKQNAIRELPYFGQDILVLADKKGSLTDKAYLTALKKNRLLMRTQGIDAVMAKYKLDALVAITNGPAHLTDLVNGDSFSGSSSSPAAVAGYPHITVPAGLIHGLPVGLSFFGRAWSEPTLIRLAYAFEQATRARTPPRFLPTMQIR